MQLPQVIASAVIRTAHRGQSHGGVYTVDFETGDWRQVIDCNDASIDWEGRGNDRGLRGLAIHDGEVYVAASDELFVYGPGFRIVRSYRNRYLKFCHEVFLYGPYLFLASTRFDSVLQFDLKKRAFTAGWCLRPLDLKEEASEPQLVAFDPRGRRGPAMRNTYHINNVFADATGLYVAGLRLGTIFQISDNELKPFAIIPKGTHNARPFKSGVLINDTSAGRVVYQDREGRPIESFLVELYPKEELLNADLPLNHARPGFARGLVVWNEDFLIAGSSPGTVSMYQLGTSRPIKRVNLTKDIRNSIHGLTLWPAEYHDFADRRARLGFRQVVRTLRRIPTGFALQRDSEANASEGDLRLNRVEASEHHHLMTKHRLLRVPPKAALFHVTHWRAGSQWMVAVVKDTFGAESVVEPQENMRQLLGDLGPEKVYASAYITKPEFDALSAPADARRVVLIRDLRDTLVSVYFSSRNTHPLMGPIEKRRWFLRRFDEEQGLLYMMELALHHSAYIQRTWLEAGEPVMRLEDFMSDRAGSFKRLFRQHWRLDVPEGVLEQIANKHSFENYSGGRKPGHEDRTSHYRKGIHGQWRQHFTPKVVEQFKTRYAGLLVMAGYEKDDSWGL